jgi:hypothetical protein
MKDLRLNQLIPLTAGAILIVGCGGRSVTGVAPEEEGEGQFPNNDPAQADPSNTTEFFSAVDQLSDDLCAKQIGCDDYSYWDSASECSDYIQQSLSDYYDLTDVNCRENLLELLDCFNSNMRCNDYSSTYVCERAAERLYDECYEYDSSYWDYYDYDYWGDYDYEDDW